MHFIKSPQGVDWHYRLEGEGRQLLFLHGWGVDMRIWTQQVKYFAQHYRVLTIDLPGHGKTTFRELTFNGIVKDIEFVLDKLDFRNLIIVGSSFGGLVALKIAQERPGELKSIVFVGSQPKFIASKDYPHGIEQETVERLTEQLIHSYPSIVNIFFRSLFSQHERASRRYKWIQTFKTADTVPGREALLMLLKILKEEDLRDILDNLHIPLQFITGTEDYICRKETIEALKERMPQARFDWFEKCGHFPFLSKPHEFNAVLEEFIRGSVKQTS